MTYSKSRHPLKAILHPYVFFLKEGGKIKKDFLDYSLMMLLINSSETIHSPFTDNYDDPAIDLIDDLDRLI